MIKIGSKAKIISGKNEGWYIWVQDDSENTGGYLVIQSPNIDFSGTGYDDWFEKVDEIEKHFLFNNWVVEWFN